MIHLLVLCKLKSDVDESAITPIAREARTQLLRIEEVLNVLSGRNPELGAEWPFFYAMDVESLSKLDMVYRNPDYLRFTEKVLKPNIWSQLEMRFEMDPGKDVRYS